MPPDAVIVVSVVTLAFVIFGVTLAYISQRARGPK